MKDCKIQPTLLALDASDSACSVAVQFYNPELSTLVLDSIIQQDTLTQSSSLLSHIEYILKINVLNLDMIDAFVLANGPGRFTGLRLATSCIQGLAYSLNKPVITLNSLHLQAQQFAAPSNKPLAAQQTIWVCQKAYAGYYYHAQFVCNSGELVQAANSTGYLISEQDIIAMLAIAINSGSKECKHYVGSGWLELAQKYPDYMDRTVITANPIDAKYGFSLANQYYFNNELLKPELIDIVYAVNPYHHN